LRCGLGATKKKSRHGTTAQGRKKKRKQEAGKQSEDNCQKERTFSREKKTRLFLQGRRTFRSGRKCSLCVSRGVPGSEKENLECVKDEKGDKIAAERNEKKKRTETGPHKNELIFKPPRTIKNFGARPRKGREASERGMGSLPNGKNLSRVIHLVT